MLGIVLDLSVLRFHRLSRGCNSQIGQQVSLWRWDSDCFETSVHASLCPSLVPDRFSSSYGVPQVTFFQLHHSRYLRLTPSQASSCYSSPLHVFPYWRTCKSFLWFLFSCCLHVCLILSPECLTCAVSLIYVIYNLVHSLHSQ